MKNRSMLGVIAAVLLALVGGLLLWQNSDDPESEAAVEVTVTGGASNENAEDDSASDDGDAKAQKAESSDSEEEQAEQPAKRAPQRRRRTPRAKVPNSPAELAAAAESAAD